MEPSTTPDPVAVIDEARARIRAPWAASIAGLLFALFFTVGLVLIRISPLAVADDDQRIVRLFRASEDWWLLVGSLYLLPFSGIMFLWFVAVIRDQIGEREDRFFATVFFGSGLLFVASLFVTAAVAGSLVVSVRYLGLGPPTATEVDLVRLSRTRCSSRSRHAPPRSFCCPSERSACGAGRSRVGSPSPAISSA